MQALRPILLSGLGGFIGSAGRYLIGGWVHGLMPLGTFPLGTLVVNVSGCFLIGLLGGLAEVRQVFGPDLRVFLLIGVLGGFTTFSSFAYETLALSRDAEMLRALLNIAAQVFLGLGVAWLGYALVRS
ncbi:MAG: fluoride efflux transporter CrcB [Gammaproteobacteria bacterium]|nr:fluoride efflux transporter CrcB [Gammaproteobacteria bacterium]